MPTILIRLPLLTLLFSPAALLCSCEKPTSGQNTSEFRDGRSGSNTTTIQKESKLDGPQENPPAR